MDEKYKVFAHFAGIIKKIQTISTGDGDYRITIDIPASSKDAIKDLMDYQNQVCGFAVAKAPQSRVKSDYEDFEEF